MTESLKELRHVTMTPYEKELYITMVEMFIERYPDQIDENGENIGLYGGLPKAIGGMRENLINLGLAKGTWLQSKLLVDQHEARNRLEKHFPYSDTELLYLFGQWLDLFDIPTTRKPFTMDASFSKIMSLFVRSGYAAEQDNTYRWTDKIGPAMQSIYAWTPELEDLADVLSIARRRQLRVACETLPLTFQWRLQWECDFLGVFRLVNESWNGHKWISVPLHPWRVRKIHGTHVELTKVLIKQIGWRPKPPSLWNRFNALFKIRT